MVDASHGQAQLDATLARELTEQGASLLCLGAPSKLSFGIDMMKWTIADKFKGLKMVPPGIHYITYRSPSSHVGEISPIMGFFHNFTRGEVVVREWDSKLGIFIKMKDEEQEERLKLGVRRMEFDLGLAPYPLETLKKWNDLSSFITPFTLKRITPMGAELVKRIEEDEDLNLDSGGERMKTENEHEGDEREKERERDEVKINNLDENSSEADILAAYRSRSAHHDARMNAFKQLFGFSDIPPVVIPDNAPPHVVSRLHLDRSLSLETLLKTKGMRNNENELIAELQISFILFLIGESYEGFDQWKLLVSLLTSCEAALLSHQSLYTSFSLSLIAQLEETPKDMFIDPLSHDNFMKKCLNDLLGLFHELYIEKGESEIRSDLTIQMRKLKYLITTKFHWTLDYENVLFDEDDEYTPVVVDLSEAFVSLSVGKEVGEEIDLNMLN